jgi:peptidoglycan hydrolase-like protein with peptidoglycan-binding domain
MPNAMPLNNSAANYRPLILLQQNSMGTDVIHLQQFLKRKGFNPGPIDGRFGSRTHTAVYLFQFSRQLPLNGCVDLATWEALESLI